jgi:hypothetical protein
VVIPDTVEKVGEMVFYSCRNLRSIKVSNSITVVPVYMAAFCFNLEEIILPENITGICEFAFYGCSNLHTFEIPKNLSAVSPVAFNGCARFSDEFKEKLNKFKTAF